MKKYIEAFVAWLIYIINRKCKKNTIPVELRQANRILIISMGVVGDLTCASAFFRELRRNATNAHITLICRDSMKGMMEACPYIDMVLPIARGREAFIHDYKLARNFANTYLRDNYDIAVHLSCLTSPYLNAWLAFFSGATCRVAYSERIYNDKKRLYIGARDRFYTYLLGKDAMPKPRHEVEALLNIIRVLGGTVESEALELWSTKKDTNLVNELLGVRKGTCINIAVNLSTSAKNRDWPVERYAYVCRELFNGNGKLLFILIGAGKKAEQYSKAFMNCFSDNVLDLTGKTTLRQTYEILKRCEIYLGGDTGPLHMSVAARLKGVAVYAAPKESRHIVNKNMSVWFSPWRSPIRVVQPDRLLPGCKIACYKDYAHCIKQVTSDTVLNEMRCVLREMEAGRCLKN